MNLVYNKAQFRIGNHDTDFATAIFKLMLLRETSTYSPLRSDPSVADILAGGGVEVTVPSYSRKTLTSNAFAQDDINNRAWFDTDNIVCGNLESGQSCGGFLFYEHIDDEDDANNFPFFWFDGKTTLVIVAPITAPSPGFSTITAVTRANPGVVTSVSHGFSSGDMILIKGLVGMTQLNDLEFTITVLDADTFSLDVDTSAYANYVSGGSAYRCVTAYCKPLDFDLKQGSAITLNGGVTGFISNAPARNDCVLRLAGLSDDVDMLDYTNEAQTTMVLPLAFGGGAFNVNMPTAGLWEMVNHY